MSNLINKIEVIDIETKAYGNKTIPISISISDGSIILSKTNINTKTGEDIVLFFLKNTKKNKIYYAHNLTFEAYVFINILNKMGVLFEIYSANSIVYSMKIFFRNNEISVRCSYRLTMLPLSKLALLVDESKTPFPYKILKGQIKRVLKVIPEHFDDPKEYETFCEKNHKIVDSGLLIERYCINDVRVTKKGILAFLKVMLQSKETKFKKIPFTASSASLELFFQKKTHIMRNISFKYDSIIRKSYYGGRCEVFGNAYSWETILHFDFTGMYALSMMERVPCGKLKLEEEPANIKNLTPGFHLISFEQDFEKPFLPTRIGERLLFVNGSISGWYWFEEINFFLEIGGYVKKVHESVSCEFFEKEMSDFVKKNNNIRKISKIHSQIGKNNNNTLYGKLGSAPFLEENNIISNFKGKNVNFNEVDGIFLSSSIRRKKPINVSIASAISSKARIRLYKGFMEMDKIGVRILYCDTDSILISVKKGDEAKYLNKYFGEVFFDEKKRDTIIKEAVIALPKTYAIRTKSEEVIKIKGFKKSSNFQKFKECFEKGIKYRSNETFFSKKNYNIKILETVKETDLRDLKKRGWGPDYKTTYPLKVEDFF